MTAPQSLANNVSVARLQEAMTHLQAGRPAEAERVYRSMLATDMNQPEAAYNLAGLCAASGRKDEALVLMEHAVSIRPEGIVFRKGHARLLRESGRLNAAAAAWQRVLDRAPQDPEVHYEIALLLDMGGNLPAALAAHREALRLDPKHVNAHFAAATVLTRLGKRQEAVDELRIANELRPGDARIESTMGGLLAQLGAISESLALTTAAIARAPNDPTPLWDHATVLGYVGDSDGSVAALQRVVTLAPGWSVAHSDLLMHMQYVHPDSPPAQLAAHQQYDAIHASKIPSLPPVTARAQTAKLRIGYLSNNFHEHPIARFVEPLWAAHDKTQVELHAFSLSPADDAFTARLRASADRWYAVDRLNDESVARTIREAGIDVLIDLNGHAGGNRIDILARRPAPLQVNYLGYPNTTGLAAIDARLTDVVADPTGETDAFHTERLLRLPDTFAIFQAPADAPPVSAPPKRPTPDAVTLASAARPAKVTDAVLAAWSAALRRLPAARLILTGFGYHDAYVQDRFRSRFSAHEIDPTRIEFIGSQPFDQYLALHDRFDLMIDTFPFNGHTTTVQHLWMGVPMVTWAGQSHRSRLGASVLSSIGLHDLIADSETAFVDRIVSVASDAPRLAKLRRTMRDRMQASPLMDARTFAGDVEALLEFALHNALEKAAG